MLTGSLVAIVTPMKSGGALDLQALERLIDWHIASGTSGIVVVGTTGESPTVDVDEHCRLIKTTVDHVAKRVHVMAGVGANATAEAIALTRYAREVGADSGLSVVPYYNKPSQEGLYQHYKAINDAVGIPILIYNIPGRSIVDMSVDTMKRLYDLKNITGVKDATGRVERVTTQALAMPGFNQLSGNDDSALGFSAHGGDGCISVSSNVAPKLCSDFQNACMKGDFKAARALQALLMPLHDSLFIEPNPAPVKYALSLLRPVSAEVRLPMVPCSEPTKRAVEAAMRHAGILN